MLPLPVFRRPVLLASLLIFTAAARADEPTGIALYQKMCARCHGKNGEGAKEFPHPLVGNRTLPQLAKYISRNMPENAVGTCTGDKADKVAAYIFDAFYSAAAQARIKAPRTELARLTVTEYRNAVADLVGFVQFAKSGTKETFGLRGEYFSLDGKRKRTPVATRVDAEVRFDFNADEPVFKKLEANEIAANWRGSVVASETGLFDFVVRTEHSTKLFVNEMRKPLIDAWVKSGSDTEFRGSIYLLEGRAYPIKLEFSRGTVGVRKDRKDKLPPVKSTVALEWKPPHRAEGVIPRFNLRPEDSPTSFAVSVNLPADDRSAGYERGTAVSKAWVQGISDGAIETAEYVLANLALLSNTPPDAKDRKKKLQEFSVKLVERAFRRPLTPEQKQLYVDRQFESAKDDDTAVKRVVLLAMQSPRFLYREPAAANAKGDAFDVAARISFSLWDSLPDAELLRAAAGGKLKTREDVAREAKRMLDDPRAHAKMRSLLWQWLKLEPVAELQKDAKKFPEFKPAVVSDLQMSLDLFLDDIVWSEKSDFRQFLLADQLYLNGRLAPIYGADLKADAPFQKVAIKGDERIGVLTHPFVLAKFSYTATSSPIHRGVFLARNILGFPLRPPADAFTPLPPELHPNLSTRERITLQTKPQNCQSCHSVINPLGFTLERFDAIGRFRAKENDKAIDSTGSYVTRSGDTVKFKDGRDLARFLATSDEVHEAFVARMFHHLVKQPVLAFGPNKLEDLRRYFADNGYNVRQLAIEIVTETALPQTPATARKQS
jgi:mono/diheme cytochrome c family protein